MTTTTLLDTLASYVPILITRRLASDPTSIAEPIAESLPAAVLFVDISGFTSLAERLAKRGPAGAEVLAHKLNTYFGQLIDLITAHGGDVVKFTSKTLLALWPARAGLLPTLEEDLGVATHRAAQCSLAVQQYLNSYDSTEGVHLSARVAVGTGQVLTLHLGGVYKRWEFVVTGQPLAQAERAGQQAQPGEVVLSPQVWALVKDDCVGQSLATGNVRLETMRSPLPPRSMVAPDLSPETEVGLQAYIPGAIMAHLTAGPGGWPAEVRSMTVLFVNLPDLKKTTSLAQIQTVTRTLQTALYHCEGSINRLSMNDKGVTLVAALGLPPLAHEDDAVRGVQAALDIQAKLGQLGLGGAIGVASGQAFCGSIGNTTRREYTMIGDVVNLAEQLMQAAAQDPLDGLASVLCDEETYLAAQPHIAFDSLPPLSVRAVRAAQGQAEHVAVYRPTIGSMAATSGIHSRIPSLRESEAGHRDALSTGYPLSRGIEDPKLAEPVLEVEMIGRTQEKAILVEGLQALLRSNSSNMVIIEGEAGIGKSRLVEELLQQAITLNVTSFLGRGDPIEKSTPYYAWRPIFRQLFNLDALPLEAWHEHILAQLEAAPELARLAPLLKAVIPLDLPDNDLTAQMSGEVRADNTRQLLVQLLQTSVAQSPKLLILENAHWLDSASWTLLQQVYQLVQPLFLVVVTRPMVDPVPPEYNHLLERTNTHQLRLETLPVEEALMLVCQRLGVASLWGIGMPRLPEPVVTLLREKAAGHPFFSQQLAQALHDAGLIEISKGQCRLAPDIADLHDLDFINTIQEVIASRIDHLASQQQLTLKVASVIGPSFAVQTLSGIYPQQGNGSCLADDLNVLEQLGLISLAASPGHGDAPATGYGEVPATGYGDALAPGHGEVPAPGHGDAPATGYGEVPATGYGDALAPGHGDALAPGYGEVPAPGYGDTLAPGYGEIPAPGHGDAPATYLFKQAITQEVAYNLLAADQRRTLHRSVAEWHERTHADDLSPFYPFLAYHWGQVIEADETEPDLVAKAVDYLEKAGEQALQNYTNREAVEFFNRALNLDARFAPKGEPLSAARNLRRARRERQLGQAYYKLGQLAESCEHLRRALVFLGRPVPTTRGKLMVSLLKQLLQQILHRIWPARFVGCSPQADSILLEAARVYSNLKEIAACTNETVEVVNAALHTLNLAEAAGPSPELARAYAGACAMAGYVSWHALAKIYRYRARETARRVAHLPTLVTVLGVTGLYDVGAGQWTNARDSGEQAVEIANRLRDQCLWATVAMILAKVAYYQGDFAGSAKLWADIGAVASRCGNVQQQHWALAWRAINLLRLGSAEQVAEAITSLEMAVTLTAENVARADKLIPDIGMPRLLSYGLLAVARLRQGQRQSAWQFAEAAVRLMGPSPPLYLPGMGMPRLRGMGMPRLRSMGLPRLRGIGMPRLRGMGMPQLHELEGYAGVAEVYLTLWETSVINSQSPAERRSLVKSARQACQALRKFARVFPIGQPRAWLWQGLYDWLAGKPDKAHRAWYKSLVVAERLAMPYEQGLAHYEIGRHLTPNDPARQAHLKRAREIFTRLEATYDLMCTQTVLNASQPANGHYPNGVNLML